MAANQPATIVQLGGSEKAVSLLPVDAKNVVVQAQGAAAEATLGKDAEKISSLTSNDGKRMITNPLVERQKTVQDQAISTKTASAIAGLAPWHKEWVFKGDEQTNTELEPLFESPKAAQVVRQSGLAAMAGTNIPMQGQSPVSTLAGNELRDTRGEGQVAQAQATIADVSAKKPGVSKVSNLSGAPNMTGVQKLDDQLSAHLNAMQGSIESLSLEGAASGNAKQMQQVAESKTNSPQMAYGLSGSEFVNTLNGIQNQNSQNNSSDMGGNNRGRDDAKSLRTIDGGLKSNFSKSVNSLGRASPEGKVKLKAIGGGGERAKAEETAAAAGGATLAAVKASEDQMIAKPTEVQGHVVRGAMARERLATASVVHVSSNISNLTAQGGGEIRIRLKPDNLGELHLRVIAHGNDVRLQIKATDDRARGIIEESMSQLKENLASHNLSLNGVDLTTVAQAAHGSSSGSFNNGEQSGQQTLYQNFGGGLGQSDSGQGTQGGGFDRGQWAQDGNSDQSSSSLRTVPRGQPATGSSRSASAGGRLDVVV